MIFLNMSLMRPARRSGASAAYFAATGGTTGVSGGNTRHTFTTSGSFQITSGSATVFWEIVGGGGAGGTTAAAGGGGGGGGGAIERGSAVLGPGSYAVTVGAGGVASTPTQHPTSGGASSFNGVSALGGGRGGSGDGATNITGAQGGSGGGGRGIFAGGDVSAGAASGSNTSAGGAGVASATGSQRYGGGGGGAGAAGTSSTTSAAGVGGAGQASQAPGVSATYSGGGGGGSNTTAGLGGHGGNTSTTGGRGASGLTAAGTPGPAQAGQTPGSGGGGGPQVGTGSPVTSGGAGAAGIVHIWYVSTPAAFGDGQWSLAAGPGAGQATITLSAMPLSPNGSPIPATEYRVNGGSAASLGLTAAGSATISGLGNGATPNIEIRAVNAAAGAGAWSSVKTVTTYSAPANTVLPVISGDTTIGSTLSATAGTWTGTPTPTLARQWRVNGADVGGATGSTFATTLLDDGDVVTLRETATNVVSAVSATSSGVTMTDGAAGPVEIPDAILTSGRSAEMVAPEGVTFTPDFDAIGTHFGMSAPSGDYDPRMHNLFYAWSFGDPGDFIAPENILPAWKNANQAIGFRASHVFRTPGTCTIRLDVAGYVGGEIVRAYSERTVTIGEPASTFAGSKTYFVSPSSDWANAPSGSQHVTSLDDAAGWANEDGASGPYRIMLNRGETHGFGGRRFGFNTATGCTIHVVAGPGGGADPILTCTGGFSAGANDDTGYINKTVVFQGLDMVGPYDPVTPGDPDVTSAFSFWGPYSPQQILVDRCEMRGFGHGVYIGDNAPRHIYLTDSVIEGYGQWGLIGSHYTGLNVLGCRIQSHEGAPIDNGFDMGGTMRVGGSALSTVIASCDYFCRQGWSGIGGGYLAVQPCIRLEAEGTAGAEYNVTQCAFEGGFTMLTISRGDDPSVIVNAALDSLYFLGGYQTSNIVGVSCGGVTLRDTVAVIPATTQRLGPGLGAFIDMAVSGGTGVLDAPMQIYGNTIVNLTTETLGIVSNPGGYTAVTSQNNVIHQPNASPAQTSDAPLTTTPALWTPRDVGYRSTTVALMTDTATPSGAAASYAPASGSAALGGATSGLIPPANLIGTDRADPPNRGAW